VVASPSDFVVLDDERFRFRITEPRCAREASISQQLVRHIQSALNYLARSPTFFRMVVVQGALIAQMRRGTLQYCVLALLAEEERYGFDLVKALSAVEGMVTSEGTIYPLLSRLRRDGLVETSWRESTAGPPRRYYRLTAAGRAALEEFIREWSRFRDAVDHFTGRTVGHEL
jgi:PadR family transcriptional regulator PadR